MSLAVVLATSCLLAQASGSTDAGVAENVKLLKHSNLESQAKGAEELAKLGPKARAAIPDLIAALDDDSPFPGTNPFRDRSWVRYYASRALLAIGPESIPPLLRALRNEPNSKRRQEVARTLTQFVEKVKQPEALLRGLNEALDDNDWMVCAIAVEGIAQARRAAAPFLPRLSRLVKEGVVDLVRAEAAISLALVDPEGEMAIPYLIDALRDEAANVRGYAASALGRIGSPAREAVPMLIAALHDRDRLSEIYGGGRSVRYEATEALGRIGPDARAALPALNALLRDEGESDVRGRAAFAVLRINPRDETVMPILIRMLTERRGTNARESALTLKELGPNAKEAVPALLRVLGQEGDDYDSLGVRLGVIEALGAIGDPSAVSALEKFRADRWHLMRETTEKALEEIRKSKK